MKVRGGRGKRELGGSTKHIRTFKNKIKAQSFGDIVLIFLPCVILLMTNKHFIFSNINSLSSKYLENLGNWKQSIQSIRKFWHNQLMSYHAIIKNETREEWTS